MKSNKLTGLFPLIIHNWAIILAILVAIIAAWASIFYARQPLLEMYGFRQTQTALTSYWMIKDGWQLAYETPVAGYPWSIPFEFPIYQSIVSLISYLLDLPLDPTGRLISFGFLLSCAWPAWAITRRLKLKSQVAWVFCALLWSSPIYLFWGRTFMIETTAVFFTLVAIQYSINLFGSSPQWKDTILFSIFTSLGMLQKVTTTGPVIIVLGIVILIIHLKSNGLRLPSLRKFACLLIAFLLPFIVIYLWTNYTDYIKAQNSFGSYLTSNSLSVWNFGTLKQRFDLNVLKTIFWNRVILNNAAGFLGIGILGISLFLAKNRVRSIILISLVLFILPIFFFINLHFIHHYYQVSSTLFLISALAVAIELVLPKRIGKMPFSPFLTIILIACNLYSFLTGYAGNMRATFDASNTEILAIGDIIRRYTPEESGIVVFGADWSSEIGYYSQRKSFTVADWYKEYDSVWQRPANFLGDLKLGAIVFCTSRGRINLSNIEQQLNVQLDSSLFKVDKSFIWLPGVKSVLLPNAHRTLLPEDFYEKIFDPLPAGYTEIKSAYCEGSIEIVNGIFPAPEKIETSNFLEVEGWLAFSAKDGIAPDEIFITLKNPEGVIKYITAIRKPRPDVNEAFKQPTMADVGFKATVDIGNLNGEYILGLANGYKGKLTYCEQFKMPVKINRK